MRATKIIDIRDVGDLRIGQAEDSDAGTGCTVIVVPGGAVGGVDVRGGGPATRETDLLDPVNMVETVFAVILSGGSAYGLDAAGGVRVNANAQAITPFNQIMPRLYAAGNNAGVGGPGCFYGGGGGTIGPAMTFSYIAGQHVVALEEWK